MDLPILETQRLILRKMTPEDAEHMFEYASDFEVTRYVSWNPHTSVRDSERFVLSMIETYKTKAPSSWGIVHKHSAKLIGTIGFVSVDRTHSRAEVGFALGRKYWSQGLMTEALGEVLRFSFSDMGLNRVVAKCFVENTGSERVMQKVGMKFEGVCREEALIKGKFVDLKQYAILRSEFI